MKCILAVNVYTSSSANNGEFIASLCCKKAVGSFRWRGGQCEASGGGVDSVKLRRLDTPLVMVSNACAANCCVLYFVFAGSLKSAL